MTQILEGEKDERFSFRPDLAMEPREIGGISELHSFYDELVKYVVPNMPRSRTWIHVATRYLGFGLSKQIEDIVASGGVLLDCGSGVYAASLDTLLKRLDKRGKLNMSVIAVDPSLDVDSDKIDPRVRCLRTFAEDLSGVEDDSVDVFLATEVWQYIADKPRFIEEAFRVLKPGGICHIVIDDLHHDAEGIIRLLKHSDIGEGEYTAKRHEYKERDYGLVLSLKKEKGRRVEFSPYTVYFAGLASVTDLSTIQGALHENLFLAGADEQEFLSKHLYYPRFEYRFEDATVDLWVDKKGE